MTVAPRWSTSSSCTAHPSGARSATPRANARTVGPAPEMTAGDALGPAAVAPARRTRASPRPGGDWCSRSSVAEISRRGAVVSAATSRPRVRRSPRRQRGGPRGSRPRAASVDTACRRHEGHDVDARVQSYGLGGGVLDPGDREPSSRAAATLSGWPSRSRPAAGRRRRREGPRRRRPGRGGRDAATMAADDEPSPRPCGMRLGQASRSPGGCSAIRSNAARIACTTRWVSSSGTAPAALARHVDRSPSAVTSAVISSSRSGRARARRSPGRGWRSTAGTRR